MRKQASLTVWSGQQMRRGKSFPYTVGTHTCTQDLTWNLGPEDTNHKELLGEEIIEVLHSDHIEVDREHGLRPGGDLGRGEARVACILRAGPKPGHHWGL